MKGDNSAARYPGRDRRAVRHAAAGGAARLSGTKHVVVIGGGIAGIASATALAERGVSVTLCEADPRLGGRVSAWPVANDRSMSRGFHAFFRQYYNLRALLKRVDPDLASLVPLDDYPLVRSNGMRESFRGLPTTPPFSFVEFVRRSPSFTARSLLRVNLAAALELLRVEFPRTFAAYDGESAEEFLDRLRFPRAARDLALEVFARSFFAPPSDFGAGELVAMFHTYFLGSAEGLLFDVPVDDYQTALWKPLGDHLEGLGVRVRTSSHVNRIQLTGTGSSESVDVFVGSERLTADAVVLAVDPRGARELIDAVQVASAAADRRWFDAVAATVNAPPFVVVRLWFDQRVRSDRPAFLGTSGYGPLDNVSVLERFEAGAARWTAQHHGSVVELHGYACSAEVAENNDAQRTVVFELEHQLHRVYPETLLFTPLFREVLVRDDCGLIGPQSWGSRPTVVTPWRSLVLAGDWVRCDFPVALMERAATTGFLSANALLAQWNVRGEDIWTVPMSGLLRFSKKAVR
ncbi:MAG: FAD-dependent oxidoreductase [Terrimesophilobacter sp.]